MSRVLSSTAPSSRPEASKPRGTDAICVMRNVAEAERCCHEVRFETCRCVKMRLRAFSAPPDSLAGFGEGIRKEGTKKPGEGKATEQERKERQGSGERGMEIVGGEFASLA